MIGRKKLFTFNTLFSVLLGSLSPGASAQDSGVVAPQPLEQEASAFTRPDREALVYLRFSVMADGSTDNIEVLGGYTNALFNDAATNTVEKWSYTPASSAGEAIDYLNREHVMAFTRTGDSSISAPVRQAYDEISMLMDEGGSQAASQRIEAILANGELSTIFDYAFLNDLLASTYLNQEQYHRALAASRQATVHLGPPQDHSRSEAQVLAPELLESALRKRFLLEASLGRNANGVQTYERLNALFDIPAGDRVHEQAGTMRERLESPDPMGLLGELGEGPWRYTPRRRTFAVTDVKGSIDFIAVRCQRRNARLDFQEGVEWSLPASFGECDLELNGEPGTGFTLYEFSPQQ